MHNQCVIHVLTNGVYHSLGISNLHNDSKRQVCWRIKDKLISDVLLSTPAYGPAKAGRPAQTYIYSSYVRIRDVALKTRQKRWMIGRSGERGSGISMLAAWHDDDDSSVILIFIFIHLRNIFVYNFLKKTKKFLILSSFDAMSVFTQLLHHGQEVTKGQF